MAWAHVYGIGAFAAGFGLVASCASGSTTEFETPAPVGGAGGATASVSDASSNETATSDSSSTAESSQSAIQSAVASTGNSSAAGFTGAAGGFTSAVGGFTGSVGSGFTGSVGSGGLPGACSDSSSCNKAGDCCCSVQGLAVCLPQTFCAFGGKCL